LSAPRPRCCRIGLGRHIRDELGLRQQTANLIGYARELLLGVEEIDRSLQICLSQHAFSFYGFSLTYDNNHNNLL
jgi:hypothetical protein